jgi:hypothetical protein
MNNHEAIPYDAAVKEGLEITSEIEDAQRKQLRLGELAARIERKYGDRTIAKFAKEIGIASCTLHRHQTTWEAWDGQGKVAPGPVSYSVLRELKDVPERLKIVTENPQITRREVAELRRAHEGKPKNKSRDRLDEKKRWLRRLHSLANEATRAAEVVDNDNEQMRALLREIMEPDLVPDIVAGAEALTRIAEYLKRVTASTRTTKVRTQQHGKAAGDRPVVG